MDTHSRRQTPTGMPASIAANGNARKEGCRGIAPGENASGNEPKSRTDAARFNCANVSGHPRREGSQPVARENAGARVCPDHSRV